MRVKATIYFILLILVSINLQAQTFDEIWELYANKEFEKAIDLGHQALQGDADNPHVNLAIGRALTDSKQYKEAIPYLIKGTVEKDNLSEIRAWSLGYLGVCYYITGNLLASEKSFKACIHLNATKNATRFAKKYTVVLQLNEDFSSWEIIEKENLRFHFQDKANIKNVEAYMRNREEAYSKINEFFGAAPIKKIDFFVWDKPEEAKKLLGRRLGFASPKLCIIHSKNNQTRGHEITHILSDFGIRPLKKTKLINEGVAVYFDQTNRDRMVVAKKMLKNEEIDIIDLWNHPKNYPNEYCYAIGGALIDFLMKNGNESQLKALLKNQTPETASITYNNFDDLLLAFEQKLKQ